MKWINVESGERPGKDVLVLGYHIKFPNNTEFVCWDEEKQEFVSIDLYRLPINITHWIPLPLPPKV